MNARTASPEMTCRELIELLYDFAEDELAAEIEAICRQHLDDCPDCREYLASYLARIRPRKRRKSCWSRSWPRPRA
jgi:anti-sigma factor RsiW